MSDPSDGTSSSRSMGFLGLAAVAATALVGFNTLVVSCSDSRKARDAAQLHQIEESEHFWTEAMNDLSSVVEARAQQPAPDAGTGNTEGQPGWESRCVLLAARTAPFVELNVPSGAKADDGEMTMSSELLPLRQRAFDLQKTFVDQITNAALVGETCARQFSATRAVTIAENDRKRAFVRGKTDEGVTPDRPLTDAIFAREDLIALTGPSKNGWDIDLFWCERPGDEVASATNFTEALNLGRTIAAQEASGALVAGDPWGQIRVRKLAAALQPTRAFEAYARDRTVVGDDPNESPVIDELVEAAPPEVQPGIRRSQRPATTIAPRTRWYISAFFCKAGNPPIPQPQEQAASPADADALAR
jgi:hypothetical protein